MTGPAQASRPSEKDRRVRRTHTALRRALLELMREKGYDAVTVQDIITRADVGRSTFYTHYTDKDDLLTSGITNLGESLAGLGGSEQVFGFSLPLLRHVDGQDQLYRVLVGKGGAVIVERWFTRIVEQLVRDDLERIPARPGSGPRPDETLLARFLGGAYMRLLSEWLGDGCTPPAPAVDATFQALARATVAPWYEVPPSGPSRASRATAPTG